MIRLFRQHPGSVLTADDILAHLPENTPITSVRRALTNLANQGEVEKCGQVEGRYGRPINLYKMVQK